MRGVVARFVIEIVARFVIEVVIRFVIELGGVRYVLFFCIIFLTGNNTKLMPYETCQGPVPRPGGLPASRGDCGHGDRRPTVGQVV